ncbi:hypothetical protein [Mycobacterium sp. 852014-52144_SCH5372336]|uniref:hypothetical protein n=1 Tax=Mycobacterium sp. 852014-52144_SCH5372336 TaxID=1834115 RepID=UPI0007FFA016|nr:hypothetical protein [Mycobacterium sp. 852014-52144_SCH5372336]OBB77769.1 hypothetical protein A5759_02945 [Mycobacterium sp. 852014-52144_SCH5372336]
MEWYPEFFNRDGVAADDLVLITAVLAALWVLIIVAAAALFATVNRHDETRFGWSAAAHDSGHCVKPPPAAGRR